MLFVILLIAIMQSKFIELNTFLSADFVLNHNVISEMLITSDFYENIDVILLFSR